MNYTAKIVCFLGLRNQLLWVITKSNSDEVLSHFQSEKFFM